jgi:hypothetical protein
MAFTNHGPVITQFLEHGQILLGLAGQLHMGVNRNPEAERRRVYIGIITLYISRFLKSADPSQTRRRGNTGAFGQFNIRNAPVLLKFAQNLSVYFIKFDTVHDDKIGTWFVALMIWYKYALGHDQHLFLQK